LKKGRIPDRLFTPKKYPPGKEAPADVREKREQKNIKEDEQK
jgi:hypothetical protein